MNSEEEHVASSREQDIGCCQCQELHLNEEGDNKPTEMDFVEGASTGVKIVRKCEMRMKSCRHWFHRCYARFPRTALFIFKVCIPLGALVIWCFICGYFLAELESKNDIAWNDSILVDASVKNRKIGSLVPKVRNAYNECLQNYPEAPSGKVDLNALQTYMDTCVEPEVRDATSIANDLEIDKKLTMLDSGAFDWIVCTNSTSGSLIQMQTDFYVQEWEASYLKTKDSYLQLGEGESEAEKLALDEATGGNDCHSHLSGGAWFWFTLMTTIGYGHTVPGTGVGRAMVYVLGFVSILCFTAAVSQAGKAILQIVDEYLVKKKLKHFTTGVSAILVWVFLFWLWIIITALAGMAYSHVRVNGDQDFRDSLWLSFITITTVGFGDSHIPPENFKAIDMVYLPLMLLIGFVLLANVLLKGSSLIRHTKEKYDAKKSEEQLVSESLAKDSNDHKDKHDEDELFFEVDDTI